MTRLIRAVLFDMGGTLEDIYYDAALRLEATPGLKKVLSNHGLEKDWTSEDLYRIVERGMKKYNGWRAETEQELPASEIWSKFLLSEQDWAPERVAAIGEDLALYYDLHFYKRALRPHVPELLKDLQARGLQLGVISNVYSRRTVPINLARYELAEYFETVVTSSAFGWRKPHPSIFLEATRRMQLTPAECAYVGDTVSRDVAGARRAGYGLAIQIKSFLTGKSDTERDTEKPDAIIEDLSQVSDIVLPANSSIDR